MKILLVAINSKYIHTNLAVRSLRAYADVASRAVQGGDARVEIAEWNANIPAHTMVRGIAEQKPDAVLFSVYIWNRDLCARVAADVREIFPALIIGAGGPEVSYSAQTFLEAEPAFDCVFCGEGERTLTEWIDTLSLNGASALPLIAGVVTRSREGESRITSGGVREPIENLDEIPFPWREEELDEHRIVYYESSRGCPYSCSYCLSSIEKSVRFLSLERVYADLAWFMEKRVPLVKFVDRTFNLDRRRYQAIWEYIAQNWNGSTVFHFEIAGEILDEDSYSIMERIGEGAIQFEIGIQSTNARTLTTCGRSANTETLFKNIRKIPRTIHCHVDLIAGLPYEDLASFECSFNEVWALEADMLQLGFLKILSGTAMESFALQTKGYRWSRHCPYEVMESPWLTRDELYRLKDVEHLVDGWFNSSLTRNTLLFLAQEGASSAFALFVRLAAFVRSFFPDGDLFLPRRPSAVFECLAAFIATLSPIVAASALERLKLDFLLLGKPGSVPAWFIRHYSRDAHDAALTAQGLLDAAEGAHAPSRRTVYARSEWEALNLDGKDGVRSGYLFVYPEAGGSKKVSGSTIMYYTGAIRS